jgi:hypothetical protein
MAGLTMERCRAAAAAALAARTIAEVRASATLHLPVGG